MQNLESLGESAIPWMEDEFPKASTSIPEVLVEENAIGTLIIIIVSAIISITLLFVMAVFIDCRQQKLAKLKQKGSSSLKKKGFQIRIPKFIRTATNQSSSEDTETFADKMQSEEPAPVSSSSSVIV